MKSIIKFNPMARAVMVIGAVAAVVTGVTFAGNEQFTDEELREKLVPTYYILGLKIIGSVLLVLAGYVWDRTLMQRLKTLR